MDYPGQWGHYAKGRSTSLGRNRRALNERQILPQVGVVKVTPGWVQTVSKTTQEFRNKSVMMWRK